MAVGPVIRQLLGVHLSRRAARYYRAIFVDLAKEAAALAAAMPRDACVLDIGGGDGEPLNHLLALRPDLCITTIDPGPAAGQWIDAAFNSRVTCLAETSLEEYIAQTLENPDVLLIADVLHHIPEPERAGFLRSVKVLLERAPNLRIVVKDVEPGFWRARLGALADRYITGDIDVSLISRERLTRLFEESLGPLHREDTNLFEADRPNYAVSFFR